MGSPFSKIVALVFVLAASAAGAQGITRDAGPNQGVEEGLRMFVGGAGMFALGLLIFWLTRKVWSIPFFTDTWWLGVFPIPGIPGMAVMCMFAGGLAAVVGILQWLWYLGFLEHVKTLLYVIGGIVVLMIILLVLFRLYLRTLPRPPSANDEHVANVMMTFHKALEEGQDLEIRGKTIRTIADCYKEVTAAKPGEEVEVAIGSGSDMVRGVMVFNLP